MQKTKANFQQALDDLKHSSEWKNSNSTMLRTWFQNTYTLISGMRISRFLAVSRFFEVKK